MASKTQYKGGWIRMGALRACGIGIQFWITRTKVWSRQEYFDKHVIIRTSILYVSSSLYTLIPKTFLHVLNCILQMKKNTQFVQVTVMGKDWNSVRSAGLQSPCSFYSKAWWGMLCFLEVNFWVCVVCMCMCRRVRPESVGACVVCPGQCLCRCLYLLVPLSLDLGLNSWASTYVLPGLGCWEMRKEGERQQSKVFKSNTQQAEGFLCMTFYMQRAKSISLTTGASTLPENRLLQHPVLKILLLDCGWFLKRNWRWGLQTLQVVF